jgi:AraC family transcriptional regulator of arabinose operon
MELNVDSNMKTIVKSVGYSIHLKPFYMEQKSGLHDYLIRLQIEGESKALIHGQLEKVLAGDLLIYKPGDPYELTIGNHEDPTEHGCFSADYFLFCNGLGIDEWWTKHEFPQRISVPIDEALLNIWKQIIYEKRRVREEDLNVNDYLLRILLRYIDRVIVGNNGEVDSRLFVTHRIKQYLERHATGVVTLKNVADYAGLSVSRTTHLFKEAFGQSIMDYVLDIRIHIACERIRYSSMTLEQSAESAGFNSYSYFHRLFRKRMGLSPKQYQEQLLAK